MFIFQVHFTISQLAVSGIKVNRLDMYGEVLLVAGFILCHFINIHRLIMVLIIAGRSK